MSTDEHGVAAYFAELAERRESSLTAAAGRFAQADAAAWQAATEIAEKMQAAHAAAEAAFTKDAGWPAHRADNDYQFVQSLAQAEEED